jgi:hypothetical protein
MLQWARTPEPRPKPSPDNVVVVFHSIGGWLSISDHRSSLLVPQATQSPIYRTSFPTHEATMPVRLRHHPFTLIRCCFRQIVSMIWIICTNSLAALVQGIIASPTTAWSQSDDCFLGCSQHRCAIQHRNQDTKSLQINMVCVRDHQVLIPRGQSPLLWIVGIYFT